MKGVYLLYLRVIKSIRVRVGSLGVLRLTPGLYIYVGSAQGTLESRVRRHALKRKKKHWHIDYLTGNRWVNTLKAEAYPLPRHYECLLASRLRKIGQEIPRFGASDCHCASHLFKINHENVNEVIKTITELNPHLIELR